MAVPPDVAAECAECLARKRATLIASIRTILSERACRFKPGFSPSDVDAIHFVYASDDFSLVACALSRTRGYCGLGLVMSAVNPPFDPAIEACVQEGAAADLDSIMELQFSLFEPWFIDAWKEARVVAPELRGFFSIHDTNYVTDLDSGIETTLEATGFRFF